MVSALLCGGQFKSRVNGVLLGMISFSSPSGCRCELAAAHASFMWVLILSLLSVQGWGLAKTAGKSREGAVFSG